MSEVPLYSELSDVFAAFDLEDTGRIQVLPLWEHRNKRDWPRHAPVSLSISLSLSLSLSVCLSVAHSLTHSLALPLSSSLSLFLSLPPP